MTPSEAFFTVHRDLPREGPGLPEHVRWALDALTVPPARVFDAACGPGADTVTLAECLPGAELLAVDLQAQFVEQAQRATQRFGPRVQIEQASFMDVAGPFDLIWCAGAVYFVGIEAALAAWRDLLSDGGAVAFSEPAWKSATPSDSAKAFWEEYPAITDVPTLTRRIEAAGWKIRASRWLEPDAWAAYYDPMAERLDMLQAQSPIDPAMQAAITENRQEIANWQAAKDEIDYHLFVVTPA